MAGKFASFRAEFGRAPIPGVDFSAAAALSQDDYEYFTGTGAYSDRPARDVKRPRGRHWAEGGGSWLRPAVTDPAEAFDLFRADNRAAAGIDYGMGRVNFDSRTGIHYGVISSHSVNLDALQDFDPIYPEAEETEADAEAAGDYEADCDFDPEGYEYKAEGYHAIECLDSDIMILRSEFYTYAKFCSPCVPGAGDLDSATDPGKGIRAYCFSHDWFDGGAAPYAVFRVSDGRRVYPEAGAAS